jgi:hypothetical protein
MCPRKSKIQFNSKKTLKACSPFPISRVAGNRLDSRNLKIATEIPTMQGVLRGKLKCVHNEAGRGSLWVQNVDRRNSLREWIGRCPK